MNVIHLSTFLQGGAGKIITELAIHQKETGNSVGMMLTQTEEPGYCNYPEYIEKITKAGIRVLRVDSLFKRELHLNLKVVNLLDQLILEIEPDLIHCHAGVPSLVGLLATANKCKQIPVIQSMHGWGLNKTAEQHFTDISLMKRLPAVVAASKTDRDFLVSEGLQAGAVKLIYYGIEECCDFNPSRSIEMPAVSNPGCIAVCIGTLCDRKNQRLVLKAMKTDLLPHDFCCVFIGEDGLEGQLAIEAKQAGLKDRISFAGHIPDADHFLKKFDLFILPSKSEGLGIVIVEAFRAEIPVIATDLPVFKELVDDGENGFLFKNDNPKDLAHAIRKFYNLRSEEREKMVERSYAKFFNHFRTKRMLEEYDRLYDQVSGSFL